MSKIQDYREVVLPGLGKVKIPVGMSAEEVAAQIAAADDEATEADKAQKRP